MTAVDHPTFHQRGTKEKNKRKNKRRLPIHFGDNITQINNRKTEREESSVLD